MTREHWEEIAAKLGRETAERLAKEYVESWRPLVVEYAEALKLKRDAQ